MEYSPFRTRGCKKDYLFLFSSKVRSDKETEIPTTYHTSVNISFDQINVEKTEIGEGGFGKVHKAILEEKYPVALKKLKVQKFYKDLIEEFEVEVERLCRLEHPAVLKYFGVCTEYPNLSILMELSEGGSLYDMLHVRGHTLSSEQEQSLIGDCLKALNYIHENGVTHQDIKSTNILTYKNYSHCKLGDFGLSLKDYCRVSNSVTHPSLFATLPYQPPEILRGDFLQLDASKKADVYSMAIVLVELLTRKLPFEGLDKYKVREVVCSGSRPETNTIRMFSLRTLLKKAMRDNPTERPAASKFLFQWQKVAAAIPERRNFPRKRNHSDCKLSLSSMK